MEYRVEIQNRAKRDLIEIGTFIQVQHSAAAREWFAGLRVKILSLRSMPGRSSRVQDAPLYRQMLYGNKPNTYRILYRVLEPEMLVIVVHVRHAAREGYGV